MLRGIRVLDLTEEPGFLAGKILAEVGADVIKVEPPGGDTWGRRGPFVGDIEDPERSLKWLALNTSKRGITLNLDAAPGQDLFRSLVRAADVVLESFAPGYLAERGLDYEALARESPRLIHCAITPFGQSGPWASLRARDLVIVALGGNAYMTGDPDRPPVRCTLPTAYLHAAPEAATGVAMALWQREETGRGQFVDVSMHETQLSTLVTGPGMYARSGKLPRRRGAAIGRTREIWRARDGDVSFGLRGGAARIPNLRAAVAWMDEEGMAPAWLRDYDFASHDLEKLGDDEIARFEEAFAAFFATKTRRELYDGALRRGLLLAPCNDAREILEHPQLRFRELFTTVEYPELGASLDHPAFFAKSSHTRIGIRSRAPRIGEHNAEIFGEIGVAPEALAELSRGGVV